MTLILKILAAMNSPFFPEINNLCLLPIKLLSITYKLISEANLVPNSGFIHIYTIEQVNKTRLLYFNIKMAFFPCRIWVLFMLSIYSNHVLHFNAGYESIKSGICIYNVYTVHMYYITNLQYRLWEYKIRNFFSFEYIWNWTLYNYIRFSVFH